MPKRNTTELLCFSSVLSVSKNDFSVTFSELCIPLTDFHQETIKVIVKEHAKYLGLLDSINISMDIFCSLGLQTTILFSQVDENRIEVLL